MFPSGMLRECHIAVGTLSRLFRIRPGDEILVSSRYDRPPGGEDAAKLPPPFSSALLSRFKLNLGRL
jgi:hypothetical protein